MVALDGWGTFPSSTFLPRASRTPWETLQWISMGGGGASIYVKTSQLHFLCHSVVYCHTHISLIVEVEKLIGSEVLKLWWPKLDLIKYIFYSTLLLLFVWCFLLVSPVVQYTGQELCPPGQHCTAQEVLPSLHRWFSSSPVKISWTLH